MMCGLAEFWLHNDVNWLIFCVILLTSRPPWPGHNRACPAPTTPACPAPAPHAAPTSPSSPARWPPPPATWTRSPRAPTPCEPCLHSQPQQIRTQVLKIKNLELELLAGVFIFNEIDGIFWCFICCATCATDLETCGAGVSRAVSRY